MKDFECSGYFCDDNSEFNDMIIRVGGMYEEPKTPEEENADNRIFYWCDSDEDFESLKEKSEGSEFVITEWKETKSLQDAEMDEEFQKD